MSHWVGRAAISATTALLVMHCGDDRQHSHGRGPGYDEFPFPSDEPNRAIFPNAGEIDGSSSVPDPADATPTEVTVDGGVESDAASLADGESPPPSGDGGAIPPEPQPGLMTVIVGAKVPRAFTCKQEPAPGELGLDVGVDHESFWMDCGVVAWPSFFVASLSVQRETGDFRFSSVQSNQVPRAGSPFHFGAGYVDSYGTVIDSVDFPRFWSAASLSIGPWDVTPSSWLEVSGVAHVDAYSARGQFRTLDITFTRVKIPPRALARSSGTARKWDVAQY